MKRGASLTNFILIAGMLVLGVILIANLQQILNFQARQVEVDVVSSFSDSLINNIENVVSFPSDSSYIYKLDDLNAYEVRVRGQVLQLHFYLYIQE